MDYKSLEEKARQMRIGTLDLFREKKEAHLGGSFSMIELLISTYEVIKKEDMFILSKGHSSFPYYLMLRSRGYDPHICTHPEKDPKNGIEFTTGSLGHGLPLGTGVALARKLQGRSGDVYVMMSDGECQEGTTWETLQIAAHHKLDNLRVIIDYNKIQALDRLDDAIGIGDLHRKFQAFDWDAFSVFEGHSFEELIPAIGRDGNRRPMVTVCHTVKGKGIPEFEDSSAWHARKLKDADFELAYKRLGVKE